MEIYIFCICLISSKITQSGSIPATAVRPLPPAVLLQLPAPDLAAPPQRLQLPRVESIPMAAATVPAATAAEEARLLRLEEQAGHGGGGAWE